VDGKFRPNREKINNAKERAFSKAWAKAGWHAFLGIFMLSVFGISINCGDSKNLSLPGMKFRGAIIWIPCNLK